MPGIWYSLDEFLFRNDQFSWHTTESYLVFILVGLAGSFGCMGSKLERTSDLHGGVLHGIDWVCLHVPMLDFSALQMGVRI